MCLWSESNLASISEEDHLLCGFLMKWNHTLPQST